MKLLALVLLLCLFSCKDNVVVFGQSVPQPALKDSVAKAPAHPGKSPEYLIDSLTIKGKTYTVVQGMPASDTWLELRILYKKDTIFRSELFANNGFEFIDFDSDGLMDIQLNYLSNTPGIIDLIMFDTKSQQFKAITDFDSYPAPEKIKGTKYYYSYHRSGCADSNWGSELFYIQDYAVKAIGKIEGIGCEDEERNGIFIYKLKGEGRQEIEAINRKPGYYKDKWDFIDKYWAGNYKKFE